MLVCLKNAYIGPASVFVLEENFGLRIKSFCKNVMDMQLLVIHEAMARYFKFAYSVYEVHVHGWLLSNV